MSEGNMSIVDLLREKIEKQMASMDEQLEAAEAKAKARKARAEADVAGAELEQELLSKVNEIKAKMAEGQDYLKELAEAGDDKAEEIKTKIASFFD
jgi:chromosome segregation ATPase